MKHKLLVHITFCSILLLTSLASFAQVLAKASVDKDRILIGDSLQLTLDAHLPLGQNITWFSIDSLPHFEIISKSVVDTLDGVDGKKLEQIIVLTSFDSGYHQIPSFELKVAGKSYYSDTLGVTVAYTEDDLSKDYHDIKEIQDVPPPLWVKLLPWLIGAALLLIGLITWLIIRRLKKKKEEPETPVIKLSPYEEAMKGLEELKQKGWNVAGEEKSYYTRLNNVLRQFIARKLQISSLEKTNDELIQQLKRSSLDDKLYQQLTEALHIADFVKFARYTPAASDNEKNFNIIKEAITTLNNTP